MTDKKRNIKKYNIIQLLVGLAVIILLNIIGSYVFTRIDLTSEKRYSLSDETKKVLKNLDDYVFFKVYLEGEFPAGFKRLRNATKEMLDEFRAYSDFVQYEFINPSESEDRKERNSVYQLLMEKGLSPTDLQVKTREGMSQKIIFPGALVTYGSKEKAIELLRSQMGIPPEQQLNNSIQALEYNLANTISKLTQKRKPKVAILRGQGELNDRQMADILYTLSENYTLESLEINQELNSMSERRTIDSANTRLENKFDALIVAKPDSVFNEKDKFIIDQFIMRGGRVLWLIDPVFASMDSIQNKESTVGIAQNLNLADQLFTYGLRLNNNLVMDLTAVPIPLNVGSMGGQPQIEFFPWYYFPLVTPTGDHPIVNNLNAIKTEFVSSIDTNRVENVKKTVLLKTSPYSRVINTPAFITLRLLRDEPDESKYQGPPQPIAVLLEGKFESVYRNRIPPVIANNKEIDFQEKSVPTKMIVVSDGDIIKNQFHYKDGYPLPLGYDQYTGQTYGNKEFLLNAINYLVDDSELISSRTREFKLRLLDKSKVNNKRLLIQLANVILPVLIILIFGLIRAYMRKARYTKDWKTN
ncbi:MAG: gliding motility-associated ABC transporter substrate-binding protein GldG [Bacteroidales bacterium]|nr:gliding motility-associated ABC transporter substrate-binding protein GldG [Bacteroidales bacterium]MCF8388442.1 gliding motility-associated ABC transporter substrate-binding protein GldG [Bacteroidales bacterium]MCF8398255.1 gliding motility-associated ABC transporter substrate-binding protein GldG [Bacteroidales bacterium]